MPHIDKSCLRWQETGPELQATSCFETSGHLTRPSWEGKSCEKAFCEQSLTSHRKLIMCALKRNAEDEGKDIFQSMQESTRDEPMTRYLMYQVALQTDDTDLAAECLQIISDKTARDPRLLYACMQDSQRAGDRRRALQVVRMLLDRRESEHLHRPALIRSSIRCIVGVLDADAQSSEPPVSLVEEVCKAFETG